MLFRKYETRIQDWSLLSVSQIPPLEFVVRLPIQIMTEPEVLTLTCWNALLTKIERCLTGKFTINKWRRFATDGITRSSGIMLDLRAKFFLRSPHSTLQKTYPPHCWIACLLYSPRRDRQHKSEGDANYALLAEDILVRRDINLIRSYWDDWFNQSFHQ